MPTTTNRERIQRGLDLVREGLAPYLCQALKDQYRESWWAQGVYYALPPETSRSLPKQGDEDDFNEALDLAGMLSIMDRNWREVFEARLPRQGRNYLYITRDTRNSWAHHKGETIERNDAIFALEAMTRLLESIESPVAAQLDKLAQEVGQTPPPAPPIAEAPAAPPAQAKKKTAATGQRGLSLASRPWRDVILPHRDVQEGRLLEAEFVVNLADVLAGKAEFGYQEPVGFFERTYLTSGLRDLLTASVRRLGGGGGEPVVQLKTAFGGGKTHTMLALYHLARAGADGARLPGMNEVFDQAGIAAEDLAGAQVAVLVGTALDATREHIDATGYGITVRTLWGELGAQLGGAEGYKLVETADKTGRSPGSDTLVELFDQSGPTLILIDELVAYARNLIGRDDLTGGTFDAVLTFVQALTEAAKRSPRTLVVASIPESNIELGNEAGKRAFDALEHTFGRMEAIWKPVAPDEGFEIVRRRLFSDVIDPEAREATCREFARLYHDGSSGDFPPETASAGYFDDLQRCYPIHPEVFHQLYTNWSTMERFQRTRGVLRLMALVIHALWQRGDQSKLIMPGDIPLDDRETKNELLRYLPPTWEAVVDKDVDGESSEPVRIDMGNARFGQYRAARRIARTIFLASAPHVAQQGVRGVDEARVRLGAVEPGVPIANYNDALRQLGDRLTYLYSGSGLYWYDTQPNLNRAADERAAQMADYLVADLVKQRLVKTAGSTGTPENPFGGVHVFAEHGDVPDDGVARLVILPLDRPHENGRSDSSAVETAKAILEQRGSMPRLRKNMLVFVAADKDGAQNLAQAARQYLAWTEIEERKDELNLDAHGRKQARENAKRWDETVNLRAQEAFSYLIVPRQEPAGPWQFDARRISGQHPAPRRAANALRQDQQLVESLSPKVLQIHLQQWFWKDGAESTPVQRIWDAFSQYGYLERLRDARVLQEAIAAGVRSEDFFGYAHGVREDGRFEGLVFGEVIGPEAVHLDGMSVLVAPDAARRQKLADEEAARAATVTTEDGVEVSPGSGGRPGGPRGIQEGPESGPVVAPPKRLKRRYYGSVEIPALRAARDFEEIAKDVVQHLEGLPNAAVRLTVEISADIPDGAPDHVVRIVSENARELKFRTSEFEEM